MNSIIQANKLELPKANQQQQQTTISKIQKIGSPIESKQELASLEKKTRLLEGSLKRKAIDYDSLSTSSANLTQQLAHSRERVQKLGM